MTTEERTVSESELRQKIADLAQAMTDLQAQWNARQDEIQQICCRLGEKERELNSLTRAAGFLFPEAAPNKQS